MDALYNPLPDEVKERCWQTTCDTLMAPRVPDDWPMGDAAQSTRTFHGFTGLPPELREYIWNFYCPEIAQHSRVFSLYLAGTTDDGFKFWTPHLRLKLRFFDEFQSAHEREETIRHVCNKPSTRKLASIHKETRALVQRVLPNQLRFEIDILRINQIGRQNRDIRSASLRYRGDTDVFVLGTERPDIFTGVPLEYKIMPALDDFNLSVRHVGLSPRWLLASHHAIPSTLRFIMDVFPQLKTLYVYYNRVREPLSLAHLAWSVCPETRRIAVTSRGRVQDPQNMARRRGFRDKILGTTLRVWCLSTNLDFLSTGLSSFPQEAEIQLLHQLAQQEGVAVFPMTSYTQECFVVYESVLEQLEMQKLRGLQHHSASDLEKFEALHSGAHVDVDYQKKVDIDDAIARGTKLSGKVLLDIVQATESKF